ncbi:MAG: cell division protein FtsA [Candidatus Kapabacteria bacterium]|nr:cell division protein FtsA [Candidatus Kapabacteria bacterium]
MQKKGIVVGLDIGTSKVIAIVASPDIENKSLKILGIGITESEGLNRGVVVNLDKVVNTIKKVISQAEQQSGIKIEEVVVGIAGDHIESMQVRSIITISNPTLEITQNDVDRLVEEAKRVAIPQERRIIHVIPQDFIIDGQDGIIDPVGMSGVRMEANVHIVTGLNTAIQNIYRCVERCELKVKDIVLEPIACSNAVLTSEEKEVGVALVDIGGGTTDIAIFEEGIIRFTSIFALAGKHVTHDVRKVLGIIESQAERIKREYGHSDLDLLMKDEVFMIPGIGGRIPLEISKSYLCQIIQPRMEELFELALSEIRRSGMANRLGAGVVLTGGTILLKGTEELARKVFQMPIKIGIPSGITYSGLAPEVESPVYSTAVGLVLYALKDINISEVLLDENLKNEVVTIIEDSTFENEVDLNPTVEEIKPEIPWYMKAKQFLEHL